MQPLRILVIFYTQTGQLRKIIDSALSSLILSDIEIEYAEIKPEPQFPFPWSSAQFFQAFPESFMGIPCQIGQISTRTNNYDLILLGYSPWFLSPSIPIHAFLQSQQASELLFRKPVITIIGCRNMWVMAQEKIKHYLKQKNAKLVGNIVLRDKAPNLVSVITIIRWMFKGKKEKTSLFPAAGVSPEDIEHASRFGEIIKDALSKTECDKLQKRLVDLGAVEKKPNLVLFERNGSRIFKMWASKILKKGPYGDKRRKSLLRFFKYYLLAVLFLITPIANGIYFIIKLFANNKIKKRMDYFLQNSLQEENKLVH